MTMTRLRSIDRRLHRQRGGVAIWFALLLPVLLGFAALAVDLTRLHLVKVELQNAADAAAMGGARSLTDPGGDPFNWTAAEAKALELAQQNVANGAPIQQATIETGYWNLQSRSWSDTAATGYFPAVRATIAISDAQNNGPLNLLFAPVLGIADRNVEASATAVIAPPSGGTGIFPFAIKKNIFNPAWWDTTANRPKIDPDTGEPYVIKVNLESFYPSGGEGTWTSLTDEIGDGKSDNQTIGGIIKAGGNTTPMSISDDIWIATGTMQDLYQDKKYPLPIGQDIAVPVVDTVAPGEWKAIVAIAGFHIDSVGGNGNKSYFQGHFIDPKIFSGLDPGDGSGGLYGAYTPPILVK